jgi:hypothetical protein
MARFYRSGGVRAQSKDLADFNQKFDTGYDFVRDKQVRQFFAMKRSLIADHCVMAG